MGRKSSLEFGDFRRELAIPSEEISEPYKSTDNGYAHGDSPWAAEDAGKHGDSLLGEDSRRFSRAATPGF